MATSAPETPVVPPKVPDTVGDALTAVRTAGERLAKAVADETWLHARRGIMKSAAIVRLMGTANAESDRPHSATSAEKIVESDEQYADFLRECRQSVVDRIHAEADYKVAELTAELMVRLAVPSNAR